MRFLTLLCLCCLFAAVHVGSLHAESRAAPEKRGGFKGKATPKAVQKNPDRAASTPSPNKKTSGAGTTEPAKALPASTPKQEGGEEKVTQAEKTHAPAATLEPAELAEFSTLDPRTQSLITAALAMTKLDLTYTYGSAEPAQGGMDCSGTIYYLLRAQGFTEIPRDSSGQYVWVRKAKSFFAVVSKSAASFEFADLRPGDLLFWTGTYATDREIPISHVMLYLGTEKKTGKRVMFGASDGRSYAGIQRWGVSVFDFKMPQADPEHPGMATVDFVGYGRIPGLLKGAVASAEENEAERPESKAKTSTSATGSRTRTKPARPKTPARRD